MRCPFCNASDTKVIDSRPVDEHCSIRRRRQCEKCKKGSPPMKNWRRYRLW